MQMKRMKRLVTSIAESTSAPALPIGWFDSPAYLCINCLFCLGPKTHNDGLPLMSSAYRPRWAVCAFLTSVEANN